MALICIFLNSHEAERLFKFVLATGFPLLNSCSIVASGEAVPQRVGGSHSSKVPFSSRHIKVCGQHDLPLLMLNLLSKLGTRAPHFHVGPGPTSHLHILQLLPSQTHFSAFQYPRTLGDAGKTLLRTPPMLLGHQMAAPRACRNPQVSMQNSESPPNTGLGVVTG